MYSVFFKMSEIISNILFGLLERAFLKEKTAFKEEGIRYSIYPANVGWMFTQQADRYFMEYKGKNILFKPRLPVVHETESVRKAPVIVGKTEPERIYISWKELASDEFFKDVETLFKMVKQSRGG